MSTIIEDIDETIVERLIGVVALANCQRGTRLITRSIADLHLITTVVKEIINMARQEGFEPPTAWFVARYSIQLSYWRVVKSKITCSVSKWRAREDSNL
jgi:hypothetical protein